MKILRLYDIFLIIGKKNQKNTHTQNLIYFSLFSQLSTECSVSYCDLSLSVGVHPSVHSFLVNTLASTNINQSAPDLDKVYMTIRSQMSLIMELTEPELSELSAFELENLPYMTVYTLASANVDQSVPNLSSIYMLITSQMSSIMRHIEPEHLEFFALEFGKIAESLFTPCHLQILPNQHQIFVKMFFDHEISDEFDYGANRTRTV